MAAQQITLESMAPKRLVGDVELHWCENRDHARLSPHRMGMFVRIDTNASTNLAEWLTGRGLVHGGSGMTMRRATARHKENRTAHQRTYALVNQALG
jgi:hypothetical protein